ncbi:MAG: zinc ABC transporter substrate-binding protein, partial [Dehalococcoidia bacterium]
VSIEGAVNSAVNKGVKLFTATNHIEIRHIDEAESAPDPHFWLDPLAMKNVVTALAAELKTTLNSNTDTRARALEIRLDDLHNNIVSIVSNITPADRKLVTGHDSMGYFTQRYGFQLIGSVVPNLSTQAGVSAADIAALIAQIKEYNVKAIFVESGTSVGMVQQISNATGAAVVELSPIMLPPDGSYFTFMSNLAEKVVNGLK